MGKLATVVADLQAALIEAQAVAGSAPVPIPTPVPTPSTAISRVTITNPARIVHLFARFERDRYNRFQKHTVLTSSVISLQVQCTNLSGGGNAIGFAYPRYGLLFNGIERATAIPTAGNGDSTFLGTLGSEPDGPYIVEIVAYDAAGKRVASPVESLIRMGLWIDRNGTAKNHPSVIVQNGPYSWTHSPSEGLPNMPPASDDIVILPKTTFVPQAVPAKPLLRIAVTPFSTVIAANKLARMALSPNTDAIDEDRHLPCVTTRGITVTENMQGYFPEDMFLAVPRTASFDGARGIATTPYTLSMRPGRNGKWYCTGTHSLFVLDSTGAKITLAGLRNKYAKYYGDAPTSVTDPCFEVVGNWDPNIPVTKRFPWESWGMVWDPTTLALDMNAQPIGGEQPHLPPGPVAYLPCRFGRILRFQFNGSNRQDPPTITEHVTGLSDPWGIEITPQGTLLVTERTANKISEWATKTPQTKISDVLSDPTASVVGSIGPAQDTRRRFFYAPGQSAITARTHKIVAPEQIHLVGDWLYFSSLAQASVRRYNLKTRAVEDVCFPNVNSQGVGPYFVNFAVSDGTFGPAGTVFATTFYNSNYGRPEAFLPTGGWDWSGYTYGVPSGPGGQWNGGHYPIAVAVGNGRLGCSNAGGGVEMYCQSDAYDGPQINYASALRGFQYFHSKGYPLIHGPYLVNRTTQPLPVGENVDCDYWMKIVNG